MHGGAVTIVSANARVLVSGMPVATVADQFMVAGCAFTLPTVPPKPQPCVRVQWTTPAVRVLVNGLPPIVQTSTGLGLSIEQIPQGPPAVLFAQPRVVAT